MATKFGASRFKAEFSQSRNTKRSRLTKGLLVEGLALVAKLNDALAAWGAALNEVKAASDAGATQAEVRAAETREGALCRQHSDAEQALKEFVCRVSPLPARPSLDSASTAEIYNHPGVGVVIGPDVWIAVEMLKNTGVDEQPDIEMFRIPLAAIAGLHGGVG